MHWSVHVLLAVGPLVILALIFLVLNAVLRKTGGGYAPGWQFRCATCNRTRDAAEGGVVRIGAASAGKRVLGYCSGCHQFRLIALEHKPAAEPPAESAVHA